MKKITIVEDDHAIAEMYKLKFEFARFNVSTAPNGKIGLEVIEHERPDVILLDLMMPEMSGDEMLKKLREQPWGKDSMVIILTNLSKDEAPKNLSRLGVTDYIIKASTTPQMVFEKVSELLKNTSR